MVKQISSSGVFDAERIVEFEARLKVDKHDLDGLLEEQAELYWHVSSLKSLWEARRDEHKRQVQVVEAKVDAEIREGAALAKEKTTERDIESQKRLDKDVIAANNELAKYNFTVSRLGDLKSSIEQRGYALKELTALFLGQYFSREPSEVRNKIKEATRSGLAERRRLR
mgnify:CR=1 FL=1